MKPDQRTTFDSVGLILVNDKKSLSNEFAMPLPPRNTTILFEWDTVEVPYSSESSRPIQRRFFSSDDIRDEKRFIVVSMASTDVIELQLSTLPSIKMSHSDSNLNVVVTDEVPATQQANAVTYCNELPLRDGIHNSTQYGQY